MHPHDVLWPAGDGGHLDHRQRRGRRRQDGTRLADPVEVAEEIEFDVEVLDDRLNHQIDVGQRGSLGRADEAAEHLGTLLLGELALGHGLVQGLGDRSLHSGHLLLAAGHEDHVVAALGEDLDDARRHGSGADHAHGRDRTDVLARLGHHGVAGLVTVGVEPASGLLPQVPGGDHLLEYGGRCMQASPGGRVQRIEHVIGGVHADLVQQGQWAHGVAAPETHGRVDVVAAGVSGLEHGHCVVQVAEEQAVGDVPGLGTHHCGLATEIGEESLHRLERVLVGKVGTHELDLGARGVVREGQPEHAVRPAGAQSQIRDRQRGGGGDQHRVLGCQAPDFGEHRMLDVTLLGKTLDDDGGTRGVLELCTHLHA